MIVKQLKGAVYVVNGEGGPARVTKNAIDTVQMQIQLGQIAAEHFEKAYEDAKATLPNVHLQLCDDRSSPWEPRPEGGFRMELPLFTWEDVEALKKVPGVWNEKHLRWEHPLTGKVRVTIETVDDE